MLKNIKLTIWKMLKYLKITVHKWNEYTQNIDYRTNTEYDETEQWVGALDCHLKHRLRIFLFYRKIMFCSQDIQVFVFLTIPWFTKSVTSRVLVHETRCVFEYIFWTTTHEVTKLGQLIDISKDNNFQ